MRSDRDAHTFLISQLMADQEESRQVAMVFACSGPCGQDGRKCKTREACQLPEPWFLRPLSFGWLKRLWRRK
jgi:hypothetical protein